MKRTPHRCVENETEMGWTREETRPRKCRKTDNGDGTTWEKKKRETKAEVDGLCQLRRERYSDNRR